MSSPILKYNDEINASSKRNDIDPNWIRATITQESNWNEYALRYEPTYPYLYNFNLFSTHLGISMETEKQSQKFSWGLGQIMGAVAREQGHVGPMGLLFDPEINIEHVAKKLSSIKKHAGVMSAQDVFSSYNGGLGSLKKVNGKYPNQAYVDSVMSYLHSYEKS